MIKKKQRIYIQHAISSFFLSISDWLSYGSIFGFLTLQGLKQQSQGSYQWYTLHPPKTDKAAQHFHLFVWFSML